MPAGTTANVPKQFASRHGLPLNNKCPARGDSWKESYGNQYKYVGPDKLPLAWGIIQSAVQISRSFVFGVEDYGP